MTAELIVRASMGAVSGLNELGPAFTRITGHKLVVRQESRAELEQRLISDAGTNYVGNLPDDLHEYVVFAIAIMAVSKEQEAARALIGFVTSPEAAPLLQKAMMEPASR